MRVYRSIRESLWACLVFTIIAGNPLSARAHAVLVESSPKDEQVLESLPEKITLRFDARIEKKVFTAKLLDAEGKKIDLPDAPQQDDPVDQIVLRMPALKPGKYRLQYQVLANDGHSTPGQISFTVTGEKKP